MNDVHSTSNKATADAPAGMVAVTAADFIPLPKKNLIHRGVSLSRATIIRAIHSGRLKSRLFRQPGRLMGRRYILRESLESFIVAQMEDVSMDAAAL